MNQIFSDTNTAYALNSDADLKKAHLLFSSLHYPSLVRFGGWFLLQGFKLRLPLNPIVKATLFSQFCGGESLEECRGVVEKLGKKGVGTILDFAAEGGTREEDVANLAKEIARTVDESASSPYIPFAVFKPTALFRFELLEKASEEVRTGKNVLSDEERAELKRCEERVFDICQKASKKQVPILIDAEETWIQDYPDQLVETLMQQFNNEKVIIYNTAQMYLKNRLSFIAQSIEKGKKKGYKVGMKLVRGAYMEKERERAARLGYESPIHETKEAADHDFDAALKLCVQECDVISIVAGTHNENSSLLLAKLLDEQKIPRNDSRFWFSQLYGMGNHISFNLAKEGFNVAKYLPYGSVATALPYLLRRAQENTSVQGQSSRELALIRSELERRNRS